MDVEVNPGGVSGVRIRYRLGDAEFRIALSALYQLLLLNPQRGCSILSGLREWEPSCRLEDLWAANTPCWASVGELGCEGCADDGILLSSCGLSPSTPRNASPAKPPPPADKPKPPAFPPPPPPSQKKGVAEAESASTKCVPNPQPHNRLPRGVLLDVCKQGRNLFPGTKQVVGLLPVRCAVRPQPHATPVYRIFCTSPTTLGG